MTRAHCTVILANFNYNTYPPSLTAHNNNNKLNLNHPTNLFVI